jgi:hypothetical protein
MVANAATEEFVRDLEEIERRVCLGYKVNPGRILTKTESEKLLAIIQRVQESREVSEA